MKQKQMEKNFFTSLFPPSILKSIINAMYFLFTEDYSFWDSSCQSLFLFSRDSTMQSVLYLDFFFPNV